MYFPRNISVDEYSKKVVSSFKSIEGDINSYEHSQRSNEVLSLVRPYLQDIGFVVETSKAEDGKIRVPVLFGLNGKTQLAFEADAYNEQKKYVIEVEAGRAVTNYQFLKDFFEACAMHDVDYLCIAVRNLYYNNKDFDKVCAFFDAMYTSNRMTIPLKGLLIIGY